MNQSTQYYKVAGHVFSVTMAEDDPLWNQLDQYEPFKIEPAEEQKIFGLTLVDSLPDLEKEPLLVTEPDPGMSRIDAYVSGGTLIFEMAPLANIPTVAILHIDNEFKEGRLLCKGKGRTRFFALNSTLMLIYAFSTSTLGTLLMHSSVTVHNGKGNLFLGKSGTGKSTHSRMWLENIPGAELLNDDNPVLRVIGDEVRVYGSPWSGKTPCYRNLDYPAGAIVRIKRAPYNKATRLPLMEAYVSVYSSCSSLRPLRVIADGLHSTISSIAAIVPCYVMECLPNAEAALVCRKAVEDGEYDQ